MRDAHKYRENGRVTTKTEYDYEATKQAIKDAVGEDYHKWVESLFKDIEEKSGIRNNTDTFTCVLYYFALLEKFKIFIFSNGVEKYDFEKYFKKRFIFDINLDSVVAINIERYIY